MEVASWAFENRSANLNARVAAELWHRNVEFRLPPIAIADMPHYNDDQQLIRTSHAEPVFGVSELGHRFERPQESLPSLVSSIDHDPQNAQTIAPEPQERPKSKKLPVPHNDAATKMFTFVNLQTTTGRRDRAAESQIRSHAMKQIQQERRKSKLLRQTVSGNSCIATMMPLLSNLRDRETCMCPYLESASVADTMERETWNDLGILKANKTPLSTSGKASWGGIECPQCSKTKFLNHNALNPVSIPSPNWSIHPSSDLFLKDFHRTTASITRRMERLLYYLTSTYFEISLPNIYGKRPGLSDSVLRLQSCLSDEANLHAWCSMAAYHQSFQMMSSDSSRSSTAKHMIQLKQEEASHHMYSAMRIINSRFQENKDTLSVNTVRAVATLVVCAAFSDEPDACKTHHKGLIKLVELRGGIDTFPRVNAVHVSRIDSNAAWTEGERPGLPLYRSPPRLRRPYSPTLFLYPYLRNFLPNSLFRVACDLQTLSIVLEDSLRNGFTKEAVSQQEIDYCEDTFVAAQYGLADFPYPKNNMDQSVMYYQQNCWRNAAFIYLNTAIRGAPSRGLLQAATSRLTDSLEKSNLSTGWAPYPDVLLWVLFMGLIGSFDESQKTLFALQLQRLVKDMKILTFEHMRSALRHQLWRDLVLDKHLRDVWMTVSTDL